MRERESSSREERTPTVNTTLKAVVPPLESNRMPREDAKANKKGRNSFSNECRVSDEEETAPPPTQRPTERQPLNEDNAAKRRVSPPASMSVGGGGGGRRSRKQPENGTVLFPFDSRFSHDFDCWQSEWMRRRRSGRGHGFHNTHTQDGRDGREAPKGERRWIFFNEKKKKFGEGFGWKLRTLICF